MSIAKQYLTDVERTLAYVPTWLPTTRLQLGDIVELHKHGCRIVSNLEEQGLPLRWRTGSVTGELHHQTYKGVTIKGAAQSDHDGLAASAAVRAANGVLLRDPLKPADPALPHTTALP